MIANQPRPSLERVLASAPLALLIAALSTLLLYGASLQAWWSSDDANIVLHARSYAPWRLMFDPAAYRSLIPYSLQPLLSLSFGADLALFGLEPRGFYLHQLLAIALSGWLVQRIVALWAPAPLAYGAMALVLAGTPVAFASQYLMVRHYVDGLALFLLALWLVLLQLRGTGDWLRWPAALAFALAVSAKEVFVPLGLLPLLLPLGTARQRWRAAWPWLVVLALYVVWRRFMLGEFIGGYLPGGYLQPLTPALLGRAVLDAARLLWPGPWPWLVALVLGIAGLALALRGHRPVPVFGALGGLAALAGLLGGPLLPLISWPGFVPGAERYFLVAWTALAVLLALAVSRLVAAPAPRPWSLAAGTLALLALAGAAWSHARPMLERSQPWLAKSRAVGQFVLDAPAQAAVLVDADIASWYVRGLRALRTDAPATPRLNPMQEVLVLSRLPGEDDAVLALGDASDLATHELAGRRVFAYDPGTRAMQEVTAQLPQRLAAWRASLAVAAPMAARMDFVTGQRALHWQFTGPPGASFAVISRVSHLPIPARLGLRMDQAPRGCFRVRMHLPDGRLAYSPLLRLQPVTDPQGRRTGDWGLRWEGASVVPGDPANPAEACPAAALPYDLPRGP